MSATRGRVLVIGSNAHELHLRGDRTFPTGNYLNEMVVPMQMLRAAGFELVVATPLGVKPHLDVRSITASHFGGDESALRAALEFYDGDDSFRAIKSLSAVIAGGLDGYDGVFVPGGHAPITDLSTSAELGEILRHAHVHAKPTAMLCHGPIAALAAIPAATTFRELLLRGDREGAERVARGWAYRDYHMTIFSDSEEKPVEAGVLGAPLLFSVADALTVAGGRVENGADYTSFVVTDRELITGQNPRSDRAVAIRLIEALAFRNARLAVPAKAS